MDDQTPTNQNEGNSDARALPPDTTKKVDPVAASAAAVQQLANVEKEMSGFEKSTLRWAKTAVIMSGLAAIFVCAQWREMHSSGGQTDQLICLYRNQVGISQNMEKNYRNGLISFQRAYISFTPTGIEAKSINDGTIQFRVPVINAGNTPTRDMTMRCDSKSVQTKREKEIQFLDTESGFTSSIPARDRLECLPVNNVTVADFNRTTTISPDRVLFLWGWTTYRDVFPGTPLHKTDFCYVLGFWSTVPSAPGAPQNQPAQFVLDWKLCDRHNCADDECTGKQADYPVPDSLPGAASSPCPVSKIKWWEFWK